MYRIILFYTILILPNLSCAEQNLDFESHQVKAIIENKLINFAGAYQIKYTPCGSSGCITAEIFDPIGNKTIAYYPDAYIMIDDDERKEFIDKYKKNSNLLIIQGVSSVDLEFRRSYYLFNNNELTLLKEEFPLLSNPNK
jgi:hypothetical protein